MAVAVVLYDCEMWVMIERDKKRTKFFEVRFLRRVERAWLIDKQIN